MAGTRVSRRTSTFPVMLRVASTDSVCAMKPDDHRMKILMPDDGILPKHRYSLPPVRFGRPFLDRYEALISLVRREQRLVFVRHFLTKLGCAVARLLRQEISNRAGAFVVLRYPPAFSAAAAAHILGRLSAGGASFPGGPGFSRWPRLRLPAMRRSLGRCCCCSHLCSPLHDIALRLACLLAHEPPSPHPFWFFRSLLGFLDHQASPLAGVRWPSIRARYASSR